MKLLSFLNFFFIYYIISSIYATIECQFPIKLIPGLITPQDMYLRRLRKIRTKKNIVAKKVFEITPILGEILALSSIEKIGLVMNYDFLVLEQEIFHKYLIMLGLNPSDGNSSKLLINFLLCDWKKSILRQELNIFMNALCKGDKESIIIFKEIITSYLIDHFMNKDLYYLNDIASRQAIMRILNSFDYNYEPIAKLMFIKDNMRMEDRLKEKLTFIVLEYFPKEKGNFLV